jgi:uncharacterized integral membrane protein (TIGR00698 family)
VPGLLLLLALAAAAIAAREAGLLWVFSPIVAAILLGMAVGNGVGIPAICRPGVRGGAKQLLRLAIVLLGFQLTITDVLATGVGGIAAAIAAVSVTLPVATWIGVRLGVKRSLATLIATGTAICGASAIVAANDVVRGSEDDVAYALAIVTLFGTIAIFLWPPLGAAMGLGQAEFGRWAGASIHEVGQVVAAGFQYGHGAGETATTVKLARVLLLAPALVGLATMTRAAPLAAERRALLVPPYVAGFLGCVAINSTGLVPAAVGDAVRWVVPVLFCMALGGIGLQTRFGALARHGVRPVALGGIATLLVALVTLAIVLGAAAAGL